MPKEETNIKIQQKLKEIETAYNIDILCAVESGSRAWGFASDYSDFDVRFIYRRKPEAYLKLNPDKDTIEASDNDWDFSGWDLDKALKLLYKSNPTLYEWMRSPIRYYESDFYSRIKPLMQEYFDEKKMLYHYINTARHHIKDYLGGDVVELKKYLHALRPILACIWIRTYHNAPPASFEELCHEVLPENLKEAVGNLLDLKINGPSKIEIPQIKEIDEFFDEQIAEIDCYLSGIKHNPSPAWDNLNKFFCEEIYRE